MAFCSVFLVDILVCLSCVIRQFSRPFCRFLGIFSSLPVCTFFYFLQCSAATSFCYFVVLFYNFINQILVKVFNQICLLLPWNLVCISVYFSSTLIYSIYVNNIQLSTPFPDFSRLEATTERIINIQEYVLYYCTFKEILRRDVFHPGMKFLYETYCISYTKIPPWDGMKTSRVHINLVTNIWRNDCILLISFALPSRLLYLPGSHVSSP